MSKFSSTLRLSLLIRELRRQVGRPLKVHIGATVPHDVLKTQRDRTALMNFLFERVHTMADIPVAAIQRRAERLPVWLRS